MPRAEFTPNASSASQQVRSRSASNTSPKRPDKPALASMLRATGAGARGNSADALKSQFQFLKDQEMTIDPNDACIMLFKLGAQFVSAIGALESDLAESKAAAAHAAREAASLRQDLISKENLLSAYNKLDFIKSSMSVSVLQTSINNIGAFSEHHLLAFPSSHPDFFPPSESNIKKYDLAGTSSKGANPQAPRSSGVPPAPESTVRPPGGIPEGQRIFELVNSKFRALDDLVYVLKKRILSLETNEELADAVKQFGNVGELLEDNKRLRAENQKLRAREQRFLADPLLRRRQLNMMTREQLQTLIICLQNELSASRNVLDRHTVKQVAQVR